MIELMNIIVLCWNLPRTLEAFPYAEFVTSWCGWIVEIIVLWDYDYSNNRNWVMLLFIFNALILGMFIDCGMWSLKGKPWKLCMFVKFM